MKDHHHPGYSSGYDNEEQGKGEESRVTEDPKAVMPLIQLFITVLILSK